MARLITSNDGLMDTFKGKSLYPVYAVINDKGEDYEKRLAVLKDVFVTGKHNNFGMKITDEVGVGDFSPIEEGAAYGESEIQEGFSSQADFVEWTNLITLTKTMMEDNITSDLKKKAGLFGQSEPRTREKFRAALLGGGLTGVATFKAKTFNAKTADGVSLFHAEHPSVLKSGSTPSFTQSNRFTNVLDKDTFGEIVSRMQNFKDDKGDVVGVTPNTVIIPNSHALKQTLFGVIGSDKDPKTSNNEYNYLFGSWRVIVSPELSNTLKPTEYIIADLDYNEMAMGAVWGDRVSPEFETYLTTDKKRNMIISGRSRYTAMFHDFRAFAIGGTATGTTLT